MDASIELLNQMGRLFTQNAGLMLVQSSVLIVLLLIMDKLLFKRARASLRYCILLLILIKLVLSPHLASPTGVGAFYDWQWTAASPVLDLAPNKPMEAPTWKMTEPELLGPLEASTVKQPSAFQETWEPIPITLHWRGLAFLIWILGIVLFLILFIKRNRGVMEIVRSSKAPDQNLLSVFNQCRNELGIDTPIDFRISSQLISPAVCRVFRPLVILPEHLVEILSQNKLRAVLTHELLHVKRADLWVNLAQTVLQVFYFFNPFVWLANAHIRRVREQAVDEMALTQLNGERSHYSNTLIDIAEALPRNPQKTMRLIGVAEHQSRLKERILLMMNRPVQKSVKLSKSSLLLVAVMGFLLLPMARTQEEFSNAAALPDDHKTYLEVTRAIDKATNKAMDAYNSDDMETLFSTLTEDMIWFPDQMKAEKGLKAARAFLIKNKRPGVKIESVNNLESHIWICNDLVYHYHPCIASFEFPGMVDIFSDYRHILTIWEKQPDGTLKMKLESWNPLPIPEKLQKKKSMVYLVDSSNDKLSIQDKVEIETQIAENENKIYEYYKKCEFKEMARFYAKDSILIPWGGAAFHGKDMIIESLKNSMNQKQILDIETEYRAVDIHGAAKLSHVAYQAHWTYKKKRSNESDSVSTKGVRVWKLHPDGKWRVLIDLQNMNNPVPPINK